MPQAPLHWPNRLLPKMQIDLQWMPLGKDDLWKAQGSHSIEVFPQLRRL